MSITEQVQADMIAAMKARDKDRASALRMMLSRLQIAGKESAGEFGPDEEIKVLASEKKRRQQSAQAYREVGRDDRAVLEEAEAAVIGAYLPAAMSPAELEGLVEAAITDTGASGIRDMGKVMSQVMQRAGGGADGKFISKMVKDKLSGTEG